MGTKRIAVGVAVGLAGFAAAFALGRMTAEEGGAGAGTTRTPLVLSIRAPEIDLPTPVLALPALVASPAPPVGPQPAPPSPTPPTPMQPPPPPPPVTTGIG